MLVVLIYVGILEAAPLAIVLAYNRMVPLSTSSALGALPADRASFGRGRTTPEEEPLMGVTGGSRRFDDDNPFSGNLPRVSL